VATATALISVFMFDKNFAANLSQAIGESIGFGPLDMWEVGAAGIVGVLAGALYRERRR
jgi:hypothetical protein